MGRTRFTKNVGRNPKLHNSILFFNIYLHLLENIKTNLFKECGECMTQEQQKAFERINSMQSELSQLQEDYWWNYINMDSWQFWVMLLILVIPLVLLIFVIDKSKLFLILFYGFSIHMLFGYIDAYGTRNDFWSYPYFLTPFFTYSVSLDVSLIPVAFLLTYQWTLNKNKNFYLYSLLLSAFFAFIFKPILVAVDLFTLFGKTNYFHLFLIYCLIFLIARIMTNFFVFLQKKTFDSYVT